MSLKEEFFNRGKIASYRVLQHLTRSCCQEETESSIFAASVSWFHIHSAKMSVNGASSRLFNLPVRAPSHGVGNARCIQAQCAIGPPETTLQTCSLRFAPAGNLRTRNNTHSIHASYKFQPF